MERRSEGIVLRGIPYGEADLIVAVLTRDFGLMKFFAKSPRKTKSRFGSSLEPLTVADFAFWGKSTSTMPRLTGADIIKTNQHIRDRYFWFVSASAMLSFTLSVVPEAEEQPEILDLLLGVLALFGEPASNSQPPPAGQGAEKLRLELLGLLYRIRLLGLTGYLPALAGCFKCGRLDFSYYFPEGRILCRPCSGGRAPDARQSGPVSPGALRLFEALAAWDLDRIPRLKPSASLIGELDALLHLHEACVLPRGGRTAAAPGG